MNNDNAELQAALDASYANHNNMERAFAASLAPVNYNNNNIALAMAASRANNENRRKRNANTQRLLRQEQNNAYERALAANRARNAMNTPPLLTNTALAATSFNTNDQMVPGNFAALASTSVVRKNISPDNINSLASEFPSFPRALIERILKDKQGNINASRKNLVRRKKYGGKKNRRKTKRRN
jgi:hypothetical protein